MRTDAAPAKLVHPTLYSVWARVRFGSPAILLRNSLTHYDAVRHADSAVESYGFNSSAVVSPRTRGGFVTYKRYRTPPRE